MRCKAAAPSLADALNRKSGSGGLLSARRGVFFSSCATRILNPVKANKNWADEILRGMDLGNDPLQGVIRLPGEQQQLEKQELEDPNDWDAKRQILVAIQDRMVKELNEDLVVMEEFISPEEEVEAANAGRELTLVAKEQSKNQKGKVSTVHNVNSNEAFVSVALNDQETLLGGVANPQSASPMTAEHFADYGDGHQLTYFRLQVPSFGLPPGFQIHERIDQASFSGIERVRKNVPPADCPDAATAFKTYRTVNFNKNPNLLKWKVTLNRFPPAVSEDTARSGFPYHVDLHANGGVTVIVSLLQPGRLEFAPGHGNGLAYVANGSADHAAPLNADYPVLADALVPERGALVLQNRVRWNYFHRVARGTGAEATQERISLVFGCW